MTSAAARRGQPLVALVAIVAAWIGVRASLWEDPVALSVEERRPDIARVVGPQAPIDQVPSKLDEQVAVTVPQPTPVEAQGAGAQGPFPRFTMTELPSPILGPVPAFRMPTRASPPAYTVEPPTVANAVAHQVLWMAALSQIPVPRPPVLSRSPTRVPEGYYAAGAGPMRTSRWSGDAWLLLRKGNGGPLSAAPALASYGASQIGGVIRYHLAPASRHNPAARLRASSALDHPNEREVALGLSARPLAGLPVVVAGEARLSVHRGRTEVRPAGFAYTELAPFALPKGAEGEVYLQAGYVGGHDATAFIDGQASATKVIWDNAGHALRVGAGTWGGAQKGAARLDIGPTANLRVALGPSAAARIAVDWRFRIAGEAAPSSGPALTLSAGF